MTILEFANLIVELTESASEIAFEPLPVDDPQTRQPDITRARNTLDWEPTVPLKHGLDKTIGYFRSLIGQEVRT